MEAASFLNLVLGAFLAVCGGAFLLVWGVVTNNNSVNRKEHSDMRHATNNLQQKLDAIQLDAERRYVDKRELEKLEKKIDSMNVKLDNLCRSANCQNFLHSSLQPGE